jgi:hypothetical protein
MVSSSSMRARRGLPVSGLGFAFVRVMLLLLTRYFWFLSWKQLFFEEEKGHGSRLSMIYAGYALFGVFVMLQWQAQLTSGRVHSRQVEVLCRWWWRYRPYGYKLGASGQLEESAEGIRLEDKVSKYVKESWNNNG